MEKPANNRSTTSLAPPSLEHPPSPINEPLNVNPPILTQNSVDDISPSAGGRKTQQMPEQVMVDLNAPPPTSILGEDGGDVDDKKADHGGKLWIDLNKPVVPKDGENHLWFDLNEEPPNSDDDES